MLKTSEDTTLHHSAAKNPAVVRGHIDFVNLCFNLVVLCEGLSDIEKKSLISHAITFQNLLIIASSVFILIFMISFIYVYTQYTVYFALEQLLPTNLQSLSCWCSISAGFYIVQVKSFEMIDFVC